MKKICTRCKKAKPASEFYANKGGANGVSPYCKTCDNARPRKATAMKVNRMRARHRAVADLIGFHQDEFEALLAIRLAEAMDEAVQLAKDPAAEHYQADDPVRLRPGPRMEGQSVKERIDVARCSQCVKHHDAGHVCPRCGTAPTMPSGVRPKTGGIDPALLDEFNRGTARAARR